MSLSLLACLLACNSGDDNGDDKPAAGGSGNLGGSAAGGSAGASGESSAGAAGAAGAPEFQIKSPYAGKLVINELCSSNHSGVTDEGGAYPDWVELMNTTDADISLAGFYISDEPLELTRAQLGSELVVPAHGYLLLYADSDIDQGPLHLPYNISAAGEVLYLSDPDLMLIDQIPFGPGTTDWSYARHPDATGEFAWCDTPTPRESNGDGC